MKRRKFFSLLGAAAVWSAAARAQQPGKPRTIGILASTAAQSEMYAAFVRRLNELGWAEGRTIVILYRWGEGTRESFSKIATEFVRLKVDVIVANGTPAVLAAKQATSNIPIIFPTAGDPVGTGLVSSLAHPGGNLTGLGFQTTDTAGKRVELLREIIPNLRKLAILSVSDDPASTAEAHAAQTAGSVLDLEVEAHGIQRAEEISPALEAFKGHADALYVATSPLLTGNSRLIGTLAQSSRLPTMNSFRLYVDTGGLMSYGANFAALFRRAADIVDKILHGTKPNDIPVEQPTKFELVINLTTAKALGLTIPASFLPLADELVE